MSTDLQKDEAQLKKRFLELYEKAYQRNVFLFTGFLGLAEQESFWQCSGQMNRDSFSLSGGMEDAERVMIRFGNPQELGYEQEFPIVCMHLYPPRKKFAEDLTHRDFLGALMNLGIERHLIGDILIDGKYAYIFCMEHIIGVIKEQLDQVRHTRVFVEEVSWEETGYVQKYTRKEGFVASMRLDVLVSQAFSLSRNISEKLLKSQKVFHNGKMCLSGGQKIKQGDIISVRGYGKFLVEDLGKTSKKGRQFITLAIFQ